MCLRLEQGSSARQRPRIRTATTSPDTPVRQATVMIAVEKPAASAITPASCQPRTPSRQAAIPCFPASASADLGCRGTTRIQDQAQPAGPAMASGGAREDRLIQASGAPIARGRRRGHRLTLAEYVRFSLGRRGGKTWDWSRVVPGHTRVTDARTFRPTRCLICRMRDFDRRL